MSEASHVSSLSSQDQNLRLRQSSFNSDSHPGGARYFHPSWKTYWSVWSAEISRAGGPQFRKCAFSRSRYCSANHCGRIGIDRYVIKPFAKFRCSKHVGFSFNGTNGAGFLEAFQSRIASGESSKWKALDSVSRFLLNIPCVQDVSTYKNFAGVSHTDRYLFECQCVCENESLVPYHYSDTIQVL